MKMKRIEPNNHKFFKLELRGFEKQVLWNCRLSDIHENHALIREKKNSA